MTTLSHKSQSIGIPVVLALALVGAGVAQYTTASWPFARTRPAAHQHAAVEKPAPLAAHSAHGPAHAHAAPMPSGAPAGYAAVSIDSARSAALGLTTAPVEEREFERVLRSVGVITLDETRTAHVHSKVRGWIDGISVNFVGRKVRAGEPLCSIYSQEVYSAEIEFLSLLDRAAARPAPDPLLDAARRRLALWDVPASEIERLEKTREARRTFPLLAPRAGIVVSKEAIEGMYVDPSLELYTVSDTSRVWVLVDVYEADVPYVHVGNVARLSVEGEPAPVDGKVSFLAPTLDEATRTRKVRVELGNQAGRFLPGSFVAAEMKLPMSKGLSVPESAVIRTGARSIVFVAPGDTNEHLEPREVTLGPLIGDRYRVEGGLRVGERVAISAQFLLDSESRLRATSAPGAAHAH